MFDSPTFIIVVGTVWLTIGLCVSLIMNRRGHNGFGWLVVGTLFGPLSFVMAFDASRHDEGLKPVAVGKQGTASPVGPVDVLAGYDGTAESHAALEAVVRLLGDRLGRLTVATVVPFDNIAEAQRQATADLEQLKAAAGLASARVTELKVLHGRASEALRQWATEDGYELIAVGARGAGLSKRILGSAASELASGGKVPVLVVGEQ